MQNAKAVAKAMVALPPSPSPLQLGPAMLEGLIRAARMEISVAEKTRTANPRK
jgi:hypothetical protein